MLYFAYSSSKVMQIFISQSRHDYIFCAGLAGSGFYSKTRQRCLETGPLRSLLLWPWEH